MMTKKIPVSNLFLYPQEEVAFRTYAAESKQSLMAIARDAVVELLVRTGFLPEDEIKK